MPEDRPCFAELVKDISQLLPPAEAYKPPPLKTDSSYLKIY